MRPVEDSRETQIELAMAAWRSHSRHQREADHWLRIFEQRTAALSGEERESVHRRTKSEQRP